MKIPLSGSAKDCLAAARVHTSSMISGRLVAAVLDVFGPKAVEVGE